MSEVYDRYVDTAGNYHYTDIETGHHVIRKSYGCDNCKYRFFPVTRSPCDNCAMSGDKYSEWTAQTNADRIRSMTDEEIVNLVYQVEYPWCTPMNEPCRHMDKDFRPCDDCMLEWLKEEVKT